jgi:hypothetical protein
MQFDVFAGTPGKMKPVQQAQIEAIGATLLPPEGVLPPGYEMVKEWLENVKNEAIQRLRQAKAIASNQLASSINVRPLELTDDAFTVVLEANAYWKFVDLGVKGADSALRAPNSPYSYKQGGKRPPLRSLQEWIAFKGIKMAGAPGRERAANNRTLSFLLSRAIHSRGLRATRFMSDTLTEPAVNTLVTEISGLIDKQISLQKPV